MQRINETTSEVAIHTSLSALFIGPSSLIHGRLYRTIETVAGTKKEIHDFSKMSKRRIVIKTTTREGTPNAMGSSHFFHRPRRIETINGAITRRINAGEGLK